MICWHSYDVIPWGCGPQAVHDNCANISCVALGHMQRIILGMTGPKTVKTRMQYADKTKDEGMRNKVKYEAKAVPRIFRGGGGGAKIWTPVGDSK